MFSRTTRILLVVAVLAGAAYLLIGRIARDSGSDESSQLVPFDITNVDGVVLQRKTDTLAFARSDSLWQMTEPVSDSAEYSTIESLLNALDHADIARDLGATDDLKQFGLAPPQTVITLLSGTDTLLVVALGKRTVDDAWCYARTRSKNLLLVPTDIARASSLPRDAYRNHRVVDFQLRDVASYDVNAMGNAMSWIRDGRRWYTVVDGDTIAGDSVAVESVLRRLRGLRIASFIDGAYAFDTDRRFGIDLWRTGHVPLGDAHFFCAPDSTCQGGTPGRSFVLNDRIEDLYEVTLTRLRDRRLLQFSPPDAERIEVSLPGASGAVVRTGGVWAFPNPAMGRIDAGHAADFVRALRALKWSDAPNGPAVKLQSPRFSVTVAGPGGTIIDEMKVEGRDDTLWLVTSRSSHGVWLIEREDLDALAKLFVRLKTP